MADTFSRLPPKVGAPGPTFVLPQLSPSLDGAAIVHAPDDKVLQRASDALAYARKCAASTLTACRAIFDDQTATVAARHLSAKKHSFEISRKGVETLQKAVDAINIEIESVDLVLRGPAVAAFGGPAAVELRAALAKLSSVERRKVVLRSVADGDDTLAAAVLNAHHLVSGMGADEQAIVRGAWQQARHPDLIKRRTELEKAREHTERGGRLLIGLAASCYNEQVVAQAQASAAAARAAVAASLAG